MVFTSFVNAIGYGLLAYILFKLLKCVYNVVYPFLIATPISDLVAFSGGDWAVVTGSTDGIGKAYAFQLAKKGFNILLISRSNDKLQDTKSEIEARTPSVKVNTIVFDFGDSDVSHYQEQIGTQLDSLKIGILVNNVGLSYNYPERLTDVEGGLDRLRQVVVINTVPPTLLSAMVLKQMIDRKRGVVVNISSAAALGKMSLLAIYSASKKYLDWMGAILRLEFNAPSSRLVIQTINPMMVATKMSKVRPSFFVPTPDHFVRNALNTIGVVDQTSGCMTHQIMAEWMTLLPEWILTPLIAKQNIDTKMKVLRKRERDAKNN